MYPAFIIKRDYTETFHPPCLPFNTLLPSSQVQLRFYLSCFIVIFCCGYLGRLGGDISRGRRHLQGRLPALRKQQREPLRLSLDLKKLV